MRAATAVANAAIEARAGGLAQLSDEDNTWALDTIIRAASQEGDDRLESSTSTFPWGASRLSARSLARVLRMSADEISDGDYQKTLAAVNTLAGSHIDEVRRVLAEALAPFWSSPCRIINTTCAHAAVFTSFRNAVKSARLGALNPKTGARELAPLEDPEAELADVPARDLLLEDLVAPIVATTDAARSICCVRDAVRTLRVALLDAHRRASAYYVTQNYRSLDVDSRLAVPRALLMFDDEELRQHLTTLADEPRALGDLLRMLASVATVDAELRPTFRRVWPSVMDVVLGLIEAGRDPREADYGGERALAALVPRPLPPRWTSDGDAMVRAAATGWPTVTELSTRIERWLSLAAGEADSVESLLGFLDTQALASQVRPGLGWLATIVTADYDRIANRSFLLPAWLERVRGGGLLDSEAMKLYQQLVDGLSAAKDGRVIRIQQALE
jgi:hypothetical protein